MMCKLITALPDGVADALSGKTRLLFICVLFFFAFTAHAQVVDT